MQAIYLRESDSPAKFILIEGLNGSGKTTQAKILAATLAQNGTSAVFNHEPSSGIFGQIIRQLIDGICLDSGLLHRAKDFARSYLAPQADYSRPLRQFYGAALNVLYALEMDRKLSEWEKQIIFVANRMEDLRENILPNLEKNVWVIQDRYDLSCFFHGMSNGVDFSKLLALHQKAIADSYLAPDLIIYYWLPVSVALERLGKSGKIIDVYENQANLERIEKAAREILSFKDENPKPHQPLVREFQMFQRSHQILIVNAEPSLEEISRETWHYVQDTFHV
ncbi:MAG TPA: hypothetical protein PKZ02_01400 [Candidatus Paceibacterota bacterium]|nr:hypothetical protein [Candidatus Paceibacterota bacterium]